MTESEREQLLIRTVLAGNEYIRQLEAEVDNAPLDDRAEMAKAKWRRLLPQSQRLFL